MRFDTRHQIPEATIHDVLRNDRRRQVIEHLRERAWAVSLRDLSDWIAEAETGESPPPRNIRDSVYVSLHQTHLPKLDDIGVVEYDRDRKTVALNDTAREVDLYMEVVSPYGVTWAAYYRGLAILGLLTVVLAEVGTPLVARIDVLLWTSGFLSIVALSTVYQLWSRRWLFLQQLLDSRRPP